MLVDKIRFYLLSFLTVFSFCTPKNPIDVGPQIEYPGMALIPSHNDSVILGSNSTSAQLDEKPAIAVHFTYDFFIDTTEVTIKSYRNLIGSLPRECDSLGTIDDLWPVIYVSWYDAVLYCNARSKHENLDTIYSYISVERTPSGEIFRLTGLNIDFKKVGYRLPTEAEWVFAARGNLEWEYIWGEEAHPDSATRYAWYTNTSQHLPHIIATLSPNRYGIYDMAGNATEWINESKISFTYPEIADFVGGTDFGAVSKVLKGGSYNHDMINLRIPCRSDLYPVDAASRNRYTGFRCAAGVIKNPIYLTNNNQVINLEPVSLTTGSLVQFIGSNNARLVFVNISNGTSRTLCYVDYRSKPPIIYQFTDRTDICNPTISPDGEWVAWANRGEGSIENGSVFVRRLKIDDSLLIALPDTPAFVPRWFVEPTSIDTFVVYVSSAQLNDQVSWRAATTKMMRFANGRFSGVPLIVEPHGAYHGGRSVDGTYLATGYPLLKMKNLTTQEEKILFYSPFNGKKAGDTSQVCNVSISPGLSTDNQVLFLDFGSGRDTSSLTATTYHSHEYIFLGDFTGKVLTWYQVPPSYYSWDHTEWSTQQGFAVSTAATANGAHRSVFCINLRNGKFTLLCEGTDLYHPFLWIAPGTDTVTTDLNLDSIGQYDSPHLTNPQALLAYKMRLFWHYAESLDVIFVGSSVAADGIDPRKFTGLKGINMAVGAGDLATSIELIRNYIFPHCPMLKIIGISFDMNMFFLNGGAGELFGSFTQSKGYQYDKSNRFWSSGIPGQFKTLIKSAAIPVTEPPVTQIDSLGLIDFMCLGWGPAPPPAYGDPNASKESALYRQNIKMLEELFYACSLQNVKLLLVNFPLHPGYRTTETYGPLGPSQATAHAMIQEISAIAAETPNVFFYDANAPEVFDFVETDFFDFGHLCVDGAAKLSTRIDSIFHAMLNQE